MQRAPLLLATVLGTSVSSAATPAGVKFGGRIVVVAGGNERVISVDAPSGRTSTERRWNLRREVLLRRVSPLWKRLDGSQISEDPAFRGREFTESGELVGRPVNITVRFEFWVEAPRSVDGVKVTVELDELLVAAHSYKSFLGYVRTVDTNPLALGRLPPQAVDLKAGTSSGHEASKFSRGFEWCLPPGRRDVVRLAGRAYGLRGRCRVSLTAHSTSSFGATTDAQVDVRGRSDSLSSDRRYHLAARPQERTSRAPSDWTPAKLARSVPPGNTALPAPQRPGAHLR